MKSHIEIPFSNVEHIKQEMDIDEICLKIKDYIQDGWPKQQKFVDKDVVPYYKIKEELTIVDDLILKGNQILIPKSMRRQMLEKLHEGHTKMSRLSA